MEFMRKTRLVKDDHHTPEPESSSYTGFVSCKRIHIALTTEAFQGVDVLAADIRNVYLQDTYQCSLIVYVSLTFVYVRIDSPTKRSCT